jgi:serine/threonine-protein kinase
VKVGPRAKEVVTVPKLEPEPSVETPPPVSATSGTPAPMTPGPAAIPPESPRTDASAEPPPDHTVAYVVGGIGIVGIGIGSYFGLRAISKNSDAKAFCNAENVCNDPQGPELTKDAQNAALISNIGFAVGGAALATGLVLYFMAPGGDEASAVRVVPTVAKNGAGLSVGGSFR